MTEEETNVGQVMGTNVHTVELNTNARDCAKTMARRKVGYAVVVQRGTAVGMITDSDLVTKVIADGLDPSKVLVRDIMSTPLLTIVPSATMTAAAKMMVEYKVRRLVVVDAKGNLAGIVAATDLAKTQAEKKGFTDVTLNAIARLESPTGGPYQ
jgi:CBS domain-containing protein